MAEGVQSGLVQAAQVARDTAVRQTANGINYASFGETNLDEKDLERMVQAVPVAIAGALGRKTYYFVPLALSEGRISDTTLVAPVYTPELGDQAICHRNVSLGAIDGVFISTRLLGDRFALAFEFFINVGHAFVDAAGVPESFNQLVWAQAVADVRPRGLAHESKIEAFFGGEAAFRGDHQAGAIQQRHEADNDFHRSSPAAVITAWAISMTRLLSLMAALRSSA